MPVEPTAIDGVFIVRWDTHGDDRGFFRQTYQVSELEAALGRPVRFRQGNHSRSAPGVLRGFHAEPWDKLVYVVSGTAFAALADLRPDSPTFAQVITITLGDPPGERARVWVTQGVGNSYCAIGDAPCEYLYDVTEEFRPDVDKPAVAWDDPDLAVDWPISDPVLSVADRSNPRLRDLFPDHTRFRGA